MQIIAFNRCWTIHFRWLFSLLVVVGMLVGLALWQLERAAAKTQLLQRMNFHEQQGAISVDDWQALMPETADGMRVEGRGIWLAPFAWLVDNQIVNGRIGYDLVIPVQLDGGKKVILLNLGWIAAPKDRAQLPAVVIPAEIQVQGIVRSRWGGLDLQQTNVEDSGQWPMRIQRVNIATLGAYLDASLYPAIIYQLQNSPYTIHYKPVIMSPERHRAYALQWLLLAVVAVVVAIAASAKSLEKGALE